MPTDSVAKLRFIPNTWSYFNAACDSSHPASAIQKLLVWVKAGSLYTTEEKQIPQDDINHLSGMTVSLFWLQSRNRTMNWNSDILAVISEVCCWQLVDLDSFSIQLLLHFYNQWCKECNTDWSRKNMGLQGWGIL